MPGDDELLTTAQLAQEMHLTERAIEKWRMLGTGPRFAKIGRKVLYRRADIRAWVQSRTRDSTSEQSA